MAEIRIEKKENPSWFPWLLGLLALVAVVWLATEAFDDDENEIAVAEIENTDYIANTNEDYKPQTVNLSQTEEELFDKNWDGTEATFDENYDYFMKSISKIDANMNLDHDYSNLALRSLANNLHSFAVENGIDQNVDLRKKVVFIKNKAEQITKNPTSTKHADMIKAAALSITEAMEIINEENFDNSIVLEDLKEAAQNIDKSTLTLEQKSAVKDFFREAANALKSMKASA